MIDMGFSRSDAHFLLGGPVGDLEVMTTCPEGMSPVEVRDVVVICHPNPLELGTMRNKVVTTLSKAFDRLGYATVRFNFRGVGKSVGEYGHKIGEMDDLRAVVEWVREVLPGVAVSLAGFSFGGFIAASVVNDAPAQDFKQLLCISPAVDRHDFSGLSEINVPWHVVLSECDEIVSFKESLAFVRQPPSELTYYVMEGASHFFHGMLIPLRECIIENYSHSH